MTTSIDAEKILRMKGVLEPATDQTKTSESGFSKKEELIHYFSVGSSYLQD